MSKWQLFWALCISAHCSPICGPQNLAGPKGRIAVSGASLNCSWSIAVPPTSVLLLRLERLQLGPALEVSQSNVAKHSENCLSITSADRRLSYSQLCSDMVPYDWLAVPSNALTLTLEVTSESQLELSYTSYVTECPAHQLQCYHARLLERNVANACADGQLACDGLCQLGSARCGAVCFDVERQRCDGVLDCKAGEDELGCRPNECPGQISCPERPLCLRRDQICDGRSDCAEGFDEAQCAPEGPETTHIVAVVFGLMLLLFVYLMCRCLTRRRSIQDLLDHPLDVPLPPFRGPGDEPGSEDEPPYTDADFRPGGDIYESFAANVAKIKGRRQLVEPNVTLVEPAQGQDALSKYFMGVRPVLSEELAALATIKITRDRCHGLRKAKSEERPMTRLLFIDRQDDAASDCEAPSPALHAPN